MPHPVNPHPSPEARVVRDAGGEQGARSAGRTFRETLEASGDRATSPSHATEASTQSTTPSLWAPVRAAGRRIAHGQRVIDRAIDAAGRGRVFSHAELIALQAGVYRYSQELQLASKLVDGASRAIRQTLRSQR